MAENKSTSAEERMAALEAENQALRQRVAALEGSAGQTTSHPDQPFRFAQQKKEGVVQTLNIDEVFEPQLLKGKRVLVTGGNRGLGLAMVRALVDCGAEVLATCRRSQGELAELGDAVQVITGVDVTKDEDMATLVAGVGEAPLDVLINNAGYGCFVCMCGRWAVLLRTAVLYAGCRCCALRLCFVVVRCVSCSEIVTSYQRPLTYCCCLLVPFPPLRLLFPFSSSSFPGTLWKGTRAS